MCDVSVTGISIEGLASADDNARRASIWCDSRGHSDEIQLLSYLVGERAAQYSGIPEEVEVEEITPFDIAGVDPIWIDEVRHLADKALGPISTIAETLLQHSKLSEEQYYQILVNEIRRQMA
jgi:hypothetical protein